MRNPEFQFFESILFQSTGQELTLQSFKILSGGCIDQVAKLETASDAFLLKWKEKESDQFEVEANGLDLLRSGGTIKIPEVLGFGTCLNRSFLLLEYIEPGVPSSKFWENFGVELAAQHRQVSIDRRYGLNYDNYIGSLVQSNKLHSDWLPFFIEERLEKQVTMAHYNGLVDQYFLQRFRRLYPYLPDHIPPSPASLLHGDLWSGNFLVNTHGEAALIDPAVYYGHREMELAFTRLFGGFNRKFYDAYNEAWPLEPDFEYRIDLYNLYPLLVHVNLFGASYLSGIESTLKRFT